MNTEKRNAISLLEYIAAKEGCQYLSDLSKSRRTSLFFMARIIREIDPNEYTLQEWNDAIEYITGETVCFDTVEQAAQGLIKKVFLRKRKGRDDNARKKKSCGHC